MKELLNNNRSLAALIALALSATEVVFANQWAFYHNDLLKDVKMQNHFLNKHYQLYTVANLDVSKINNSIAAGHIACIIVSCVLMAFVNLVIGFIVSQ